MRGCACCMIKQIHRQFEGHHWLIFELEMASGGGTANLYLQEKEIEVRRALVTAHCALEFYIEDVKTIMTKAVTRSIEEE